MEYGLGDVRMGAREAYPALPSHYDFHASRIIDIVVSLLGLLFLLPLMVMIALAIMITDKGPIFFAHRRIGRGGRSFNVIKFRSMVTDSEARLNHLLATNPAARAEWEMDRKLRNDPRITPIGNFLRKTSFDELPQLINVLRGEMSIVGPRPIVAEEISFYGAYFPYYCSVTPGITGFWQISGRNNVVYRRRVAMDVVYARRKSVVWDLKIMVLTVPAVLMSRGCY